MRNAPFRRSAIGAAFAVLAACLAVPATAADLLQVYREALSNDQQFAAARATAQAGREKLPQALAAMLPTIGLSANSNWNNSDYTRRVDPTVTTNLKYNTNGYAVTLSQPLFHWQAWVAYDEAKLLVAQSETQLLQAKQDLILRVAQGYFDVLYAEENLKAVRAQKSAIAQQLEQAKKNFEVGTSTITDTHEAQSRYDLATAQEIAADSDLEVKRRTLQAIIGKEPGGLLGLKADARIAPPQPAEMAQWVDAAEKDNLAVQIQQAGSDVAAREVDRIRAIHYPTLDLVASYGRNSGSGALALGNVAPGYDNTAGVVGVQLNVPIFQGGSVVSQQRAAEANRDAAAAGLENSRRSAALGARQAYLGVVNGVAQIKALEAALRSSQSSLDANKLGYEVGVRINIDVLNAEQQLYSTRSSLAKARFDTLVAQLKLKNAVGTLGDDDVQQMSALLGQ
jgi:outer membrane protein